MYKRMKRRVRNIRKIITGILCCVITLNISVNAAEGTIFQVQNQTGKAGDTVTVPIEMHSGEEVGGFDLTVYYDNDTLEFESLSKGDLIVADDNTGLFDYNHKAENASIKIVYVVVDTIKADGVIANINFKLKKDCGTDLPIGMGVNEVVDNTASSNVISGSVTGVDSNFQSKVSSQNGITTEVVEESTEAKEATAEDNNTNTGKAEDKNSAENINSTTDKDETSVENTKDKKTESKEEKENKEKGKKAKKNDNKNVTLIGIVIVAILIAVMLPILIKKKKGKKEKEE